MTTLATVRDVKNALRSGKSVYVGHPKMENSHKVTDARNRKGAFQVRTAFAGWFTISNLGWIVWAE